LLVACQINPVQFGFLQNRSTTQQLLSFLSNAFNDRNQLDVIYLDISKAFDTVSHPHLLAKLSSFNIGGEIWLWFLAYITNRRQYVSINSSNSYLLPVESGVPQGSIMVPSYLSYIWMISQILFFKVISTCLLTTALNALNR